MNPLETGPFRDLKSSINRGLPVLPELVLPSEDLGAQHGKKGASSWPNHPNGGKMQEIIRQRMEILRQDYHLDDWIGKVDGDSTPKFVRLREEI